MQRLRISSLCWAFFRALRNRLHSQETYRATGLQSKGTANKAALCLPGSFNAATELGTPSLRSPPLLPSLPGLPLPDWPTEDVTPRLAALAAVAKDSEADCPHLITLHMCKPPPPATVLQAHTDNETY